MAKKSARSKGYRKTIEKKPYLSKRDITMLCVLIAIVAVGAILLFSYDDGALKVKDGKIVDAVENRLIVNGASNGKRYYEIGEIGDVEGYTREAEASMSDANLMSYRFTPVDEDGVVRYVTVSASPAGAQKLAEYTHSALTLSDMTDVATSESGAYWYAYRSAYYRAEETATEEDTEPAEDAEAAETEPTEEAEAPAEAAGTEAADAAAEEGATPEPNRFDQAVNACKDANKHGCVTVTVLCDAPSADAYTPDEEVLAIAEQFLAAVTVAPAK